MNIFRLTTALGAGILMNFGGTALAADASVYGALYQTAHLETTDGTNTESVVTYLPGTDGFIAITTNSAGVEWWTSDALGLTWTKSESNPLEDLGCVSVGRHSVVITDDASYLGADCEAGPTVVKITGLDSAEAIHNNDLTTAGYPTATVLNDSIYMFFNGGYTVCVSDACTDVTTAVGQPNSVPLEAATADGVAYLPFSTGVMTTFDGTSYTQIGDGYLEDGDECFNCNLPAVGINNGTVYVGNQDFDNGATLFQYDPDDADGDGELWEVTKELSSSDTIINKMQASAEIDGSNYLVFYTSNGDTGTGIYALDEDGNVFSLIDSGLGGDNPTNNMEVVSIVNRTVEDGGTNKKIMLFATQNMTDQTKIFVLNLDEDLAVDVTTESIVTSQLDRATGAVTASAITEGSVLKVKIPKSQVNVGDKFILYIDGEKVDSVKATSKAAITLKYKGAKNLDSGTKMKVRVGVRRAYGSGEDQIRSENIIKGTRTTVKIK